MNAIIEAAYNYCIQVGEQYREEVCDAIIQDGIYAMTPEEFSEALSGEILLRKAPEQLARFKSWMNQDLDAAEWTNVREIRDVNPLWKRTHIGKLVDVLVVELEKKVHDKVANLL